MTAHARRLHLDKDHTIATNLALTAHRRKARLPSLAMQTVRKQGAAAIVQTRHASRIIFRSVRVELLWTYIYIKRMSL